MSGVGQSFILSILPILLGLILFLILILFNPPGKKYVITRSATTLSGAGDLAAPNSALLPKNYLYDQLILRGMLVKDEEILRDAAFSKFGMLQASNLSHLLKCRLPKNLELVSNPSNCDALFRLSCVNSSQFAVAIPYLLNSSLTMVIL